MMIFSFFIIKDFIRVYINPPPTEFADTLLIFDDHFVDNTDRELRDKKRQECVVRQISPFST